MNYGKKQGGHPHTFEIPDELWKSLKKLVKRPGTKIQDIVSQAVVNRSRKISHEIVDDLKLDNMKNRTVRIPVDIWNAFKAICKKKNFFLCRQFLLALYDYEKMLRKEYVNGIKKDKRKQ
jgi:hypothetical protein